MTGEIKQDSISSLNVDIKEERDKKDNLGPLPKDPDHKNLKTGVEVGEGENSEPLDLQQFMGAAGYEKEPKTAFLFEAVLLEISNMQAATLVQALDWSMKQIKEHWEELSWDDAAIVTVIENQLMNMKLQQKQIIKGDANGN